MGKYSFLVGLWVLPKSFAWFHRFLMFFLIWGLRFFRMLEFRSLRMFKISSFSVGIFGQEPTVGLASVSDLVTQG